MGYTTDFSGSVTVTPPLNPHEVSFLKDLAQSRRMDRTKGPLYANPGDDYGQQHEDDILSYNNPHHTQPGLWLQWTPTDDGTEIEWDGGEKFYCSPEWMKYLIDNLLGPNGRSYVETWGPAADDPRLLKFTFDHVVHGEIEAQGEDPDDRWMLVVENNVVKVADANVTYTDARAI